MFSSRFFGRMMLAPHVALGYVRRAVRQPAAAPRPKRILVAHHLLLGDALMLTALLATLRRLYPDAEIVMTVPTAIAPLYQGRPYGVVAWPFDPRRADTLSPMLAHKGFDLGLVPGDNRYSWLALALGARWIVAHANDTPAWKSWPVDRLVPYPPVPTAWAEVAAQLVDGERAPPYRPRDWPAPTFKPFGIPAQPYCVFHVGASTPLKLWQPEKWRALAEALERRGFTVVWSAGRGEEAIVAAVDPGARRRSYAGRLDLPQLWHLLGQASLLVCPDTGVAHLGRIVGTPTVTLFGPGSALVCGAGEFWKDSPYVAVTLDDFACRDQSTLFKRQVPWLRRCERLPGECPAAACMHGIRLAPVLEAADRLPLKPVGSGRDA